MVGENTPLLGSAPKMFSVFALVATCVVTCGLTVALMNARSGSTYSFVSTSSSSSKAPNCGDRDTTLKLAKHITIQGLLGDPLEKNVFEASGVRMVGDDFYVVFDNIFDIGKFHKDLPFLSTNNYLILPDKPMKKESQFEGIAHDQKLNTFYIAQEAVENGPNKFHANISEVKMGSETYEVKRACLTEIGFETSNKGIEGLAHLRIEDKVYLLGLCEGNHCQAGKNGRELGEGRVIVMLQDETPTGKCTWKTVEVLNIPKEAKFQDYSDIAVHHSKKDGVYHVAILSQENSQIWLGKLHVPQEKNPEKAAKSHHLNWELETVAVFDFPRDDECRIIYCNVEGVDFISHDLIVVVSDRMKGHGKQPIQCLDRDQSVHVFSLPIVF
jgi:hypothetical protein